MSGEGLVVMEDVELVSSDSAKRRHVMEESSPRGSDTEAQPVGVEQDKDSGNSDISEEEARTHVSDDGDHERSAADDFTEPDEELRTKIIKQAEFYFSDANILKDSFLLKHVQRNKMGYVSVKLIASFKKLKNLTKDQRVVVFCLRQSAELEVNESGTKVRRCKPLPEYDETTPSRTVVAVHLAQKNPTVDSVSEEFTKCPGIILIRILRPGHKVPQDVSKYANKHPEIGTSVCAVIEFEKPEQARKACKTMTNTEDWRSGRRVVLLGNQKPNKDGHIEKCTTPVEGEEGTKKNMPHKIKKKKHADQKLVERTCTSSSSGSDGDAPMKNSHPRKPFDDSKRSHLDHTSPRSNPRNPQHRSFGRENKHVKNGHHKDTDTQSFGREHKHAKNGYHRDTDTHVNKDSSHRDGKDSKQRENSPSSPWVQRRLRAAQDSKTSGAGMGKSPSPRNSRLLDMMGVLRQPRGPDGTKGFTAMGRGKPTIS